MEDMDDVRYMVLTSSSLSSNLSSLLMTNPNLSSPFSLFCIPKTPFSNPFLNIYFQSQSNGEKLTHPASFSALPGYLCLDGKYPGCDNSYFGRIEFSFTFQNDIYLRFQLFNTASELEHAIRDKCPVKIDTGPVYSVDPSKRHAYAQSCDNVFTPVERERIFDIDISDYDDDARYYCSSADGCLNCWPLMTIVAQLHVF